MYMCMHVYDGNLVYMLLLVVWYECFPVIPYHCENFLELHVNQLTCNTICLC